ncbi:Crp/Fnr family transcriptional regulator [Novibacillus thermophilus]|uniref:Crp/Fnr family transcriptional regulator n=1 Tax=Novibacillus thermophilus TaxID=1471761 RepID=A0A1U9K6X1_9BACL|nr:Crp/Fnr family transcriptional regulator [Novibacillus thermophilus]AQS55778.1 Crp/Fnr family transcriptional regulator [Novibacillus thermophilus]
MDHHMVELLQNIPLFNELTYTELKHLTSITSIRTYEKHTLVFVEGETREAVFFIRAGMIKTYKVDEEGNEQVISLLQKGDMFPHVGFFDDSPYPATAEVIERAELLVIRIDDFDQLLMEKPKIAIKVMKMMGQKIFQLQERLQELISSDVFRRVVHTLLRLADEYGEQKGDGIFIGLPMTNRDFANMVGTSRESVNRVLNQLKKRQLLDIDRKGILIYDLEALRLAE